MIGNYQPICPEDTTVLHLSDTLPPNISDYKVIMVFSGSTSNLDQSDMDRLTHFLEAGGGLYLGSDNSPLQSESNQMTRSLYRKECYGEFVLAEASSNNEGGNLHLNELPSIPAGTTTVAFPLDYRLKVEAWIGDEPLILSGEWGKGRIIIDGGYSRFYCTVRNTESDAIFLRILSFLKFE